MAEAEEVEILIIAAYKQWMALGVSALMPCENIPTCIYSGSVGRSVCVPDWMSHLAHPVPGAGAGGAAPGTQFY